MFKNKDKNFPSSLIGKRVREERKKKGITVEELATNVGISQSMISQIENGHTNPSLDTLWNISNYLGVPIFHFFKSINSNEIFITKKSEQPIVKMLHPNVIYRLISPSTFKNFEIFELIVEPGEIEHLPILSHRGEEFGYVIEGEIEVQVENDRYLLEEGDTIYFKSTKPHRFHNFTNKPSRGIWVMFSET